MLHSLFRSNPEQKICFHFLHSETLPSAALAKLRSLCERFDAQFAPLEVDAEQLQSFPISGRFPVEAWYRVVLPTLLPDIERVLWLDADTLVLASIEPLWRVDLKGAPLAACPNPVLYGFKGLVERLGVRDRSRYFNSGVMLMNLKHMRETQYEVVLRALGQKYFEHIRFADQDVLNAAYSESYLALSMKWNVLTHAYINVPETNRVFGKVAVQQALRAPRVLHFTGSPRHKPWSYSCGHPYQALYLQHRAAAGWPLEGLGTSARWWSRLVKRVPLRWRFSLNALREGKLRESCSYWCKWR